MSASRRGEGPSPPAPRPAVGAGRGGLWREQPHPLVQPLLLQSLPPRVLISRAAQLRKPPPTSASPQAPTARPGGSGEQASTLEVATKARRPPLPTRGQLAFLSTQPLSAPLIRKPGRMRRLLTKVEVAHLGCSLQVQAPRTTAQSRGGGCLHRGGACAFPRPSRFPVRRGPTACSLENGARREPQHQCG